MLLFALVGRQSHDEGASLAGLGRTAWPFLLGLTIGWLVLRAWRDPLPPLRTGVPLALITVAAGMLARWASDQGTALPFVIVATVFLLACLVGWRARQRWYAAAGRAPVPRCLGRRATAADAPGTDAAANPRRPGPPTPPTTGSTWTGSRPGSACRRRTPRSRPVSARPG